MSGIVLPPSETNVFRIVAAIRSLSLFVRSNSRETLSAARTYYVRKDGSDSNTGLADTAGGAFLTIQKAINTAVGLDLSLYSVTIQVRVGTYAENVILKSYVGVGPIILTGDTTTPSNVIINATAANCIEADAVLGKWQVGGFKLTATVGNGIYTLNGSVVEVVGAMNYGTIANYNLFSDEHSTVLVTAAYTISGNAQAHALAQYNGFIRINAVAVTLTGTPAFSLCFVGSTSSSFLFCTATFSGAATGKRYISDLNSSIYTGGAGPNYFPGNAAGTTSDGGQYI